MSNSFFMIFRFLILARVERFELPSRVLETRMLPLHHTRVCDPSATRTRDFFIKSEELYPTELRGQNVEKVGYAPTPSDFQSDASTKLASSPYVEMMGLEPITFRVSDGCSHH